MWTNVRIDAGNYTPTSERHSPVTRPTIQEGLN